MNGRILTKGLLGFGFFAAATLFWACSEDPFPIEARVTEIDRVAEDVKMFHLLIEHPGDFSFQAGQYLDLLLPDEFVERWNREYGTEHGKVVRSYSLASSPLSLPRIRLLVRRVDAPPETDYPPGIASTFLHNEVELGTVLTFSGSYGEMIGCDEEAGDILLIARGVGIAPMIGLLDELLAGGLQASQKVRLFFGARDRENLYFHEEFRHRSDLYDRFDYYPALSDPDQGDDWDGFVGYVTPLLESEIPDASDDVAFVAGPGPMVTAVAETLLDKGISLDNIRTDNRAAIAGLLGEKER